MHSMIQVANTNCMHALDKKRVRENIIKHALFTNLYVMTIWSLSELYICPVCGTKDGQIKYGGGEGKIWFGKMVQENKTILCQLWNLNHMIKKRCITSIILVSIKPFVYRIMLITTSLKIHKFTAILNRVGLGKTRIQNNKSYTYHNNKKQ